LIGDRNWGQLASEFYNAIIPNKLWVLAGMNFTFSNIQQNQYLQKIITGSETKHSWDLLLSIMLHLSNKHQL
jgi:hypothetical protein